jgi:NAD(P)-dependent dehydrogenase (short-subunit alcohol dehydrogenase family)
MTTQAPRVAIITGSSRGIGASIAKRLAANRITVIVNYAGRAAEADQVVTDITAQHIDPSQDGAEIVNGVADRVRGELLRRMSLEDLLSPSHEL